MTAQRQTRLHTRPPASLRPFVPAPRRLLIPDTKRTTALLLANCSPGRLLARPRPPSRLATDRKDQASEKARSHRALGSARFAARLIADPTNTDRWADVFVASHLSAWALVSWRMQSRARAGALRSRSPPAMGGRLGYRERVVHMQLSPAGPRATSANASAARGRLTPAASHRCWAAAFDRRGSVCRTAVGPRSRRAAAGVLPMLMLVLATHCGPA